MAPFTSLILHSSRSIAAEAVPVLPIDVFRSVICSAVTSGARISSFFGYPKSNDSTRLLAVLAYDSAGILEALSTDVTDSYPALTPDCSQAHWFEREIAEQWGIRPEGHPWLKPIRFHRSYSGHDAWGRLTKEEILPCVTDFYRVEGEEVHEVAVGPVHAGVIEPGHFRFQCHGENVMHLEISLGYQHRGIERSLSGGPDKRSLPIMETAAGDTTIGHVTAFARLIESLSSCTVPARAQALRGVALELERLANHTGDLGALAADVGYLPTASFCGRIRGDILNMTAMLCGNRFGRGFIHPGGVGFDLDDAQVAQLAQRLDTATRDITGAVELLWETPSVMARFEDTGAVSLQVCRELGLVGPAARACGVEMDVRRDFPFGIYNFSHIPPAIWTTGDVFARALVRWIEIQRSLAFIKEQLKALPAGPIRAPHAVPVHVPYGTLAPNQISVSLVEGWRGEICHTAITDGGGRFAAYKIVDPSFHNWMGLAVALRGQQISDFPLCNKSFNLSYCGHDL